MELNKIVKGSKKSEDQTSVINKIEIIYKLWKNVIKLFDDSSRIVNTNTKQDMEKVSKY